MPARITSSLLLVVIVLVCIGLVSLGNWQVRRLQWKTALIDRIEQRVTAPPVAVPILSKADIDKDKYEYLRVRVNGEYLHKLETRVQAVTERGPGYWVLTPLQNEDITVLVNRGFVPETSKQPASRESGQLSGEQHIIGLLRLTEPEGLMLRKNVPGEERWYSRDVQAIANARGLEAVQPYFIDAEYADVPGGFPVGGMTRLQFRNHHLVYALTWYGLALLLAGMTIYVTVWRKADD